MGNVSIGNEQDSPEERAQSQSQGRTGDATKQPQPGPGDDRTRVPDASTPPGSQEMPAPESGEQIESGKAKRKQKRKGNVNDPPVQPADILPKDDIA